MITGIRVFLRRDLPRLELVEEGSIFTYDAEQLDTVTSGSSVLALLMITRFPQQGEAHPQDNLPWYEKGIAMLHHPPMGSGESAYGYWLYPYKNIKQMKQDPNRRWLKGDMFTIIGGALQNNT